MSDARVRPLFLLSDEPIVAFGDDGLGVRAQAEVIAAAALGAATPFTVGVFGPWGHGKTSLLNAARTLLEPVGDDGRVTRPHPHVVVVEFNAWRYEREAHPIVPLVASIARAVEGRLKEDVGGEVFPETARKALDVIKRGSRSVWRALRSLPRGVKLKVRADSGTLLPGGGGEVEIDGAKIAEQMEKLSNEGADAESVGDAWAEESLYLSAFDDLARLHAATKGGGGNVEGKLPRIVVFIDDLDRCRPEAAVEILEGIKLVLSQPGFVFVLALNRDVIERYLERQSVERYGEKYKDIGAHYIDKIVQLPLWLGSHEGEFDAYIRKVIRYKLGAGLLTAKRGERGKERVEELGVRALLHAMYRCVPLLAKLSEHSPRKLVRKINELLIDERLLPENADKVLGCERQRRAAVVFPLLLVQRGLQEIRLPEQMKELTKNDALCEAIARYREDLTESSDSDGRVGPTLFRRALQTALERESGGKGVDAVARDKDRNTASEGEPDDTAFKGLDRDTMKKWLRATDCLEQEPRRAEILNIRAGRAWLTNHAGRRLVAKAVATRAAVAAAAVVKPTAIAEASTAADGKAGEARGTTNAISEELRQEIAIIERAVRRSLQLKSNAVVGPDEFGRVTRLYFAGEPITDAGAAWLARPDSGLKALIELYLGDTRVTDEGVRNLARADTGLKTMKRLYLGGTRVTDAGVTEMARADTGLEALTLLSLRETRVTDAGLKELARADTGLKALTELYIYDTQVTDAGLKDLACKSTGVKALTKLDLERTRVTDAGVADLARPDTGLKALTSLDLRFTKVTDAGVKAVKERWPGIEVHR